MRIRFFRNYRGVVGEERRCHSPPSIIHRHRVRVRNAKNAGGGAHALDRRKDLRVSTSTCICVAWRLYRGEPVAAAAGHSTTRRPLTATVVRYNSGTSWNSVPVAVRTRETWRVPFRTEKECLNIVYSSIVFQHSCRSFCTFCIVFFDFFPRRIFYRLKVRHGLSINTIYASPWRSTHSNTTINTHNFITYKHIW